MAVSTGRRVAAAPGGTRFVEPCWTRVAPGESPERLASAAGGYRCQMGKIVKFTLLGGAFGAGYTAYKAFRRDETIDQMMNEAAKVGAEAAAAGAGVGLLLSLRGRSKRKRKAARHAAMEAFRAASMTAVTLPVKDVAQLGRKKARKAAKAAEKAGKRARKRATAKTHAALEIPRHTLEDAKKLTRRKTRQARKVAEKARKTGEKRARRAAAVSQDKARDAADVTRRKAKDAAAVARGKASDVAEGARERAARAATAHASTGNGSHGAPPIYVEVA